MAGSGEWIGTGRWVDKPVEKRIPSLRGCASAKEKSHSAVPSAKEKSC